MSLGAVLAAVLKLSGGAPHGVKSGESDGTIATVPAAGVRADSVSARPPGRSPQTSDPHPTVAARSQEPGEAHSTNSGHASQDVAVGRSLNSQASVNSGDPAEQAVSVVGNPFPISESVEVGCRGLAGKCDEILGFLAQMAQEPRDTGWAGDMEARIRAQVLSEPGKYAIRALECRKTMCALETESVLGTFKSFGYGTPLYKALWEFDGVFGYERSQNGDGSRVTVTLRTYTRR